MVDKLSEFCIIQIVTVSYLPFKTTGRRYRQMLPFKLINLSKLKIYIDILKKINFIQ